jgi:hypothetical protein
MHQGSQCSGQGTNEIGTHHNKQYACIASSCTCHSTQFSKAPPALRSCLPTDSSTASPTTESGRYTKLQTAFLIHSQITYTINIKERSIIPVGQQAFPPKIVHDLSWRISFLPNSIQLPTNDFPLQYRYSTVSPVPYTGICTILEPKKRGYFMNPEPKKWGYF